VEPVWGAVRLPETADANRFGRPLEDDLSDVLGIPDPAHVRLPVGEVPTDPGAVAEWMERYRAQLELTRAGLELRKALADAAGYGEIKRLERRTKELEADATVRRTEGELADAGQALVYTFFAEVDEDSVREAVRELSAWSRRAPGRPIRLVLNSPGGSVLEGLALFDFLGELRSRGHHLQVLALGTAASMGGVLLQAGSDRLLGRNAFVLVHEVRGGAIGTSSSLGDTVEFIGRLEERLLAILAERSTLTAEQIRARWGRRDWWLTAQEAVDLGFADVVV
jgi:ATP-dependent Clp protease protease subunit